MELAFCLWLLTTSELHLNGICTQAYEGISVKVHWICMTSKHQCGLQGPYQCGGGGWGSVGAKASSLVTHEDINSSVCVSVCLFDVCVSIYVNLGVYGCVLRGGPQTEAAMKRDQPSPYRFQPPCC